MKRILALLAFFAASAIPQVQTQPDCGSNTATLTATGSTASIGNLGNTRCTTWTVTYFSQGFSGVSVAFQTAPDSSGAPGSFTALAGGNITVGTNPLTATTQAFLVGNTYAPWLNVAATLTGSGSIVIKVDGWRGSPH